MVGIAVLLDLGSLKRCCNGSSTSSIRVLAGLGLKPGQCFRVWDGASGLGFRLVRLYTGARFRLQGYGDGLYAPF